MSNLQQRALNQRNGSADRASYDWPSKVLHDHGPKPEHGIDKARLLRLADFIETLEIVWPRKGAWAPGPVAEARYVDGRTPVIGYMLESGGEGYGLTVNVNGVWKYYLTGYGIINWGWGTTGGMGSVAANGYLNTVQDVLTAEPIRREKIPDTWIRTVTTAQVADALRHFVEHPDDGAEKAWWFASGRKPKPAAVPAPSTSEPIPLPSRAPMPPHEAANALTNSEAWKALLIADDYCGMQEMATRKLAGLDKELERIDQQRKLWGKRLKLAVAMAEEEE